MNDARENEPAQEGIIQPRHERVADEDNRSAAHRVGVAAVAEALNPLVEDD